MNTINESVLDDKFIKSIKFINEVKIFNEIQNYKKIIFFDFRKEKDYKLNHLEHSIHIPFSAFDFDFFENVNDDKINFICNNFVKCEELKAMLKKYKRHYIVLIMSEERIRRKTIESVTSEKIIQTEEEKSQIIKCLLFYKALQKNRINEMGLYNLGFEKIKLHYDYLLIKESMSPLVKDISSFPSELIEHRIYVGNQNDALSEAVIKNLKITHIINVTQHVNNKFEGKGIKYLQIAVEDTEKFKIINYSKSAYEFIEDALTYDTCSTGEGSSKSASNENLSDTHNIDRKELENLYNDCNTKDFNSFSTNYFENSDLKEQFESTDDVNEKNKLLQKMFIGSYEKNRTNSRILIHCSMGVSRSPTVAIMYLMKKFSLSFRDCLDVMKLQRQKIQPIDSFMCELEDFEMCDCQFHEKN